MHLFVEREACVKDFVSQRSIRAVGSISSLLLLWAVFVSPGGIWTGFVSVGALTHSAAAADLSMRITADIY